MNKRKLKIILVLISIILSSCSNDVLDNKPSKSDQEENQKFEGD